MAGSSQFTYSEADMARAFKTALLSRHGLRGVGPVWRAFEEVDAMRGRPDFVAIVHRPDRKLRKQPPNLDMPSCTVLACLLPRKPLSIATLSRRTGLPERAVRTAVRKLHSSGHAESSGEANYRLAPGPAYSNIETWAFELKLRNTKRAIFQAQQYRLFAQRVVIVVPPSQVKHYLALSGTLSRWGIGVASFEPLTSDFRFARRPRRAEPVGKGHQVYLLNRIVSQE